MAGFTAKDVQRLRQTTQAGMMDSKRALEETGGDFEAAVRLLREKGLGSAARRSDRANVQGAVAVARAPGGADGAEGPVAAMVELKCETDFVAKSADFVNLADELASLVAVEGEQAAKERSDAIDDLKVALKENIELGRVVRFQAPPGNVLDTYLHVQSDRGVNGVLVELSQGTPELAHDVAVHIAFGRPEYLRREDVPAEVVESERATLLAQAQNMGKPEAALPKIVDGMLNGWFKERVLLEQPFAKDDKQSVRQVLGEAEVVRWAQVLVGG
jgi:elongation factor Ts